jgi:hypothetical protein
MAGNPEPKDGDSVLTADGKNLGEALSKFDFSQFDFGSHSVPSSQDPAHSDAHAALAAMSSDDALDYAISHVGEAEGAHNLDVGHVGDGGHDDGGHIDGHVDMPDTPHGS